MISENYVKFKFQSPQIRFYENTATPIRLHIIYSHLHEKQHSWVAATENVWPKKTQNICSLTLYRKYLHIPALNC